MSEVTKAADEEGEGVHRLRDIVVEEVSLVDRAANKRRFLVVKRAEDMAGIRNKGKRKPAAEDDEDTEKARGSKKPPFDDDEEETEKARRKAPGDDEGEDDETEKARGSKKPPSDDDEEETEKARRKAPDEDDETEKARGSKKPPSDEDEEETEKARRPKKAPSDAEDDSGDEEEETEKARKPKAPKDDEEETEKARFKPADDDEEEDDSKPKKRRKAAAVTLDPGVQKAVLKILTEALKRIMALAKSVEGASAPKNGEAGDSLPDDIAEELEEIGELLEEVGEAGTSKSSRKKSVSKGVRMAKDRLDRFQKAISLLSDILKELTGSQDVPSPSAGGAESGVTKRAEPIPGITELISGITEISRVVKAQGVELSAIRKARGDSNALMVDGAGRREEPQDVSWPIDMNRPISKDTVRKNASFFD